jgi:hypothetical protein
VETVYKDKTKTIILKSLKEKIKLWCFGDIHRFTRSCDEDRWQWFLKRAKEVHNENTYYLGMGDYQNFASAKEQKAIHSGELHDDTIEDLDDMIMKRNRVLAQEMAFMKPNILGLIDGNHNWTFKNGQTATEDLADRLMTESLGWLCSIALRIKIRYINSDKSLDVYLLACHGRAGGRTVGASVNQLKELGDLWPESDVVIMGHDHQRFAQPKDCFLFVSNSLGEIHSKQHRQFLCRSGSFKKAYTPNNSGYEVSRLLRPADLGALELNIGFHRDHKDNRDVFIKDIQAII